MMLLHIIVSRSDQFIKALVILVCFFLILQVNGSPRKGKRPTKTIKRKSASKPKSSAKTPLDTLTSGPTKTPVFTMGTAKTPGFGLDDDICSPKNLDIHACDEHNGDDNQEFCYIFYSQPKNWSDAHIQCRTDGGFLADRMTWNLARSWPRGLGDLISSPNIWTAITNIAGRYQWLARCPGPVESAHIKWEVNPEYFNKECSSLNVISSNFKLRNCSEELPFYCVTQPSYNISENIIDEIVFNVSSNADISHNWVSINESEFEQLTLSCNVYNKSSNEELDWQQHVVWKKDGVFLNHFNKILKPSLVENVSLSYIVGEENKTLNGSAWRQGTYSCGTWKSRSEDIIESNKVLVTLDDWLTLIIDAYLNDSNINVNVLDSELSKRVLSDDFNTCRLSFPRTLISVNKVAENMNIHYKLHLYCRRDKISMNDEDMGLMKHYYRSKFEKYNNHSTRKFQFLIKRTYITHPTYCWPCRNKLEYTENYPCKNNIDQYGNMILWNNSSVGTKENSDCKLANHKISPLMCMWNFSDGAKFSYKNPKCERTDMCPRGYTSINQMFCAKITDRLAWGEGLKEMYLIGNEINVIDLLDRKKIKTFMNIEKLLLDKVGTSKIWLPVRRKRKHAPLFYIGKEEISCEILKADPRCNISWTDGHPIGNKECLAFDLVQRKLITLSCDEKFSHISVIDSSKLNDNEYFRGSCKEGWNTTNFNLKETVCYKVFPSSNTTYNWDEANNYCKTFNSTLPLPSEGYMSWFYRNLLKNRKISSVWIGINQLNGYLDFLGSDVDKVDWIVNTNYSNIYASVSEQGWTLEGPLDTKKYIICQTNNYKKNVSLQIERTINNSENFNFRINVYPISMASDFEQKKCFQNDKSIGNFNDNFNATDVGYYECDAWSKSNPKLHNSNKVLFKDADTIVVIIDMLLDEVYNPIELDSTFLDATTHDRYNVDDAISNSNLTSISNCQINSYSYEPTGNFTRLLSTLECNIIGKVSEVHEILSIKKALQKIKFSSLCKLEDVRGTFHCLPAKLYDSYTNQTLSWSAMEGPGISMSNELCITKSSEPVTRQCMGDFFRGYKWDQVDGNCSGTPTELTKTLWRTWNQSKHDPGTMMSLSNITSLAKTLSPVDIHLIAKTLNKLTKETDYNNFHIYDIVKTMNNIMAANSSIVNYIHNKLNSTGIILESFEKLIFKADNSAFESIYHINSAESLVSADRVEIGEDLNLRGYKSGKFGRKRREEVIFEGDKYNNAEVVILLPSSLTKEVKKTSKLKHKEEKVQVLFTVYKDGILFEDNMSYPNFTLNTYIIGATFSQNEDLMKNISEDVEILFKPKSRSKRDYKCVFWDFTKNSNKGGWSTDGCRLGTPRNGYSVCLCNHLTSFAQLINFNDIDPIHLFVLDTISIIGCSLSIISIVLVFTTFILFKRWRDDTDNKVLVSLSLAIFFSMLIFLSGINVVNHETICRSVAAALHYFILASFAWSLAEAALLYLKFVKVVGAHVPKFIWKASVCAWGVPIFPVFFVLLVDNDLYYNEYSELCWMTSTAFNYAFLPFLILTVGINSFIFVLIIYKVTCGRRTIQMSHDQQPKKVLLNQVFMAIFIFFLLGLTWLFGLLAMYDRTLMFSYLFCIFNTCQGFFLFLVMICPKSGAKVLWGEFLSILTKSSKSKSKTFSSEGRATATTSLSASSPLNSPAQSMEQSTTTSNTNRGDNEEETLFNFPNSWIDANKWTDREILGNSGSYTSIPGSLLRQKRV
ncbi:unnamed protein product [Meganyctiphanes norvegica]|uniref:Uncharacterized protein n=1 Tax=Meganyctiphanes norvegica TaxID=48144 RepID=A0AAV2R2J8_MEGNR